MLACILEEISGFQSLELPKIPVLCRPIDINPSVFAGFMMGVYSLIQSVFATRVSCLDQKNLPSRHVSVGPEKAPFRSIYYAIGLTEVEVA